jgi:voltage-gated potassium channel
MADRTLLPDGRTHVIGQFAGVLIAEARVAGSTLLGQRIADVGLRKHVSG